MCVFLFLLWIVFNGRISLQVILSGLLCSQLACLLLWKILDYSPKNDLRVFRNIPWIFLYIGNLILEIVKAALDVMELSFNPLRKPDPYIMEFHSGFDGDIRNVLLANSITLTPGTITIFREGDFFVVHCLRREYAEGMEDSSFVRLLRKLK